jgi:hypothetical protein
MTIAEQIDSLIESSGEEKDTNVQIILLVLKGARESGDDFLLAKKVGEFAKDVLLPRAKERLNSKNASKN